MSMSVSSRIVKKKSATNGSLEILSWEDHLPSPAIAGKPTAPGKPSSRAQLQMLPPDGDRQPLVTSPVRGYSRSPTGRGIPVPMRKVSSAPLSPLPVAALGHTYPVRSPASSEGRAGPAVEAAAGAFDRKHAGKDIREAKEFCVDMGVAGEPHDEQLDSSDGDELDSSGPWDAEELDEFERNCLEDDPKPTATDLVTPRLTNHDISAIQDPATLDFLAKNHATLAKYIALDQSVGQAFTPSSSTGVLHDWTFITRARGSNYSLASPTASDHLSLRSATAPPSLAKVPADFGVDLDDGRSDDIVPFPVGDVMLQADSGSHLPRDADMVEEEMDIEDGYTQEEDGASTAASETLCSNIAAPPRSYFGKRPASTTSSSTAEAQQRLPGRAAAAPAGRHPCLTPEEEKLVQRILDDTRFDSEEYVVRDGEGYTMTAEDGAALRRVNAALATLRGVGVGEPAEFTEAEVGTGSQVLRLAVVAKDREAMLREGREKANRYLQESRVDRANEAQLSAIHQHLGELYQAEAELSVETCELPPVKFQALLAAAKAEQKAALGPGGVDGARSPSVSRWAAGPAAEAEAMHAVTVRQEEDDVDTELSRRIAAVRERYAECTASVFDAVAYWEERQRSDEGEPDRDWGRGDPNGPPGLGLPDGA